MSLRAERLYSCSFARWLKAAFGGLLDAYQWTARGPLTQLLPVFSINQTNIALNCQFNVTERVALLACV